MFRRTTILIPAVIAALLLAVGAASGAGSRGAAYARCPHQHNLRSQGPGFTLPVTHLRVKRMTCHRAASAIRASTFEATPGGPQFSVPGFKCTGPVGPPPPGSKPRYYHCAAGRKAFEFLVPGFS